MPDAQGLKSLGGGSPSGESPCFLTAREWCTSRLRLGCALQKAVGGAVVWCWHGSCGMPARAKGKGAVKGGHASVCPLIRTHVDRRCAPRISVRSKWAQAHRRPSRSFRRLRWTLRFSARSADKQCPHQTERRAAPTAEALSVPASGADAYGRSPTERNLGTVIWSSEYRFAGDALELSGEEGRG